MRLLVNVQQIGGILAAHFADGGQIGSRLIQRLANIRDRGIIGKGLIAPSVLYKRLPRTILFQFLIRKRDIIRAQRFELFLTLRVLERLNLFVKRVRRLVANPGKHLAARFKLGVSRERRGLCFLPALVNPIPDFSDRSSIVLRRHDVVFRDGHAAVRREIVVNPRAHFVKIGVDHLCAKRAEV